MATPFVGVYATSYLAYTGSSATPPSKGPANLLLQDGQSNSSGLARQSDLFTAQYAAVTNPTLTQAFPHFWIWSVANQRCENLQVGDNELGLDGATLAALGAPGYEDGFGWEVGLARRLAVEQPGVDYYLVKMGGFPTTSTEGSTIANLRKPGGLYELWKAEIAKAKAWLANNGYSSVNTIAELYDQFESDTANSNYQADLTSFHNQKLADSVLSASTKVIIVGAQSGGGNAMLVAAQQGFIAGDPAHRLMLDTTLLPTTYLTQDGIHIDSRSMVLNSHKYYYNLVFGTTGGDLTIGAASTTGGGNGAITGSAVVNIATPATTQILNLRYDGGLATDAGVWTSQTSRALAVKQPLAAKRGVAQSNGLKITSGNQFMYSEDYNFDALTGMTWIFYARSLVNNGQPQSFFYNGDEDTQNAFSCYWNAAASTIFVRIKSQASPIGDRDVSYYCFRQAPFTGGDCLLTVIYDLTDATDPIKLVVNGVVGTPLGGGSNQPPTAFLKGIVALFGRNESGSTALQGTIQQCSLWNYAMSLVEAKAHSDAYASESPVVVAPTWQAVAPTTTDAGIAASSGLYSMATGAGNWGNIVQLSGTLVAGTIGGLRMQFDGTHAPGAISLNTQAGHFGLLDGSFSVYFGLDGSGVYNTTWFTGTLTGYQTGAVVGGAPAANSYLRLWRDADMHVVVQLSADGTTWGTALHDFGVYAGALSPALDLNSQAGNGVYMPQALGLS